MRDERTGCVSLDTWASKRIGVEDEELTLEIIHGHQQKKVRETILHASQNSPFHRRLTEWDKGEWSDIPFTTHEDIRFQGLQMLCTSQGDIGRVVTLETSGTSGPPKRLYFTREDQENTLEFFRAGMATFTAPGEKVLILLPGERVGSIGSLLLTAIERVGAVPIPHGMVQNLLETHGKLIDSKADILVGVPSQVLALARYSERTNLARKVRIRRVLLSTDYVSETVVQELQRIWGCEVFRYYGMTEAGLGCGIECTCHEGYHLYEADFLTEIVDQDTGQPVPEGQEGEVVFTTLTRNGMPMIRYRTGDLSRFIPEPCPCGSKLRRLDTIRARADGVIKLKDGGTFTIGKLDDVLLDLPGILDFKAAFMTSESCDTLNIQVKFLYSSLKACAVVGRLNRIPSLRRAQENQILKIVVDPIDCDSRFVPAIGKRKIICG